MLSYSAAMDRWVRGERLLKHPRLLFHEREVYSYGLHYLLGRKVEWKGETLVLLNTSKRSLTTSRHQGELAQACRRAHVPFVFVSGRPTGDVRALLQGELAALDETVAKMARLARVRPPMVRLRRLQDMALAMRRREQIARLLDVERTPFVLLEAELLIQGWPQAGIDALGVEVDDDKWPGVSFPKLNQEVEDWRTARRLRARILS